MVGMTAAQGVKAEDRNPELLEKRCVVERTLEAMGQPLLLSGVGGGTGGPSQLDLAEYEELDGGGRHRVRKDTKGGAVGPVMGGRRGEQRWQEPWMTAVERGCKKQLRFGVFWKHKVTETFLGPRRLDGRLKDHMASLRDLRWGTVSLGELQAYRPLKSCRCPTSVSSIRAVPPKSSAH